MNSGASDPGPARQSETLIGIDWGITSLRAFLIDGGGGVVDRRANRSGILAVADGEFETVFLRPVGDWLRDRQDLPIVISSGASRWNLRTRRGSMVAPASKSSTRSSCACPGPAFSPPACSLASLEKDGYRLSSRHS